jgi:hypothetical protein
MDSAVTSLETQAAAVTLWRSGNTLRVEPAVEPVRSALRAGVRLGVPNPTGSVNVATGQVPLFELKDETGTPVLCTSPALEPVVRLVLGQAGYDVHTVGSGLAPLPPPRLNVLPASEVLDHSFLSFVEQHERGLVQYDQTAVDPARLVGQVALAWPDKTLAAVVRREEEGCRLRSRLREYGVDAALVTGRHHASGPSRVVVTTPVGLAYTPTEVEWLDIVIAMDAQDATGKSYMECLSHAWRARLYGLLTVDARPAPLERDQMHALFGFQELFVPRHGHRLRPLRVINNSVKGGPELPANANLVVLKRRGLWRHALRNRRVARLARAFADGGTDTLTQMLGPARVVQLVSPGVIVLVENVEHALALGELLPDWPVFTGADVCEHGLTGEQIRRLRQQRDPFDFGPLHAMVTLAVLPDLDFRRVDVVVRADGGVGLPPLNLDALVESDQDPVRPLLIVDFIDRHHPVLRQRSRARQESYEEAGWFRQGVDPATARVERFLASRPGRGQP